MPKITINDKTYSDLQNLPPEAREAYQKVLDILQDADKNGVPDILEGKSPANIIENPLNIVLPEMQQFVVDGKAYPGVDGLPPDARLKYEQAIAKLGPLLSELGGSGIPDILKKSAPEFSTTDFVESQPPIPDGLPQNPPPSVIQDESPNYAAIGIIMVVALLIVGLLGLGVYLALPMFK